MRRPWQGQVNDAVIDRIKSEIPEATLRTTFIVGFPGETDEHFAHLYEFVQRHEFDHVGVFTFSPEEGTPAYSMGDRVSQDVMDERRAVLMQAQQSISLQHNEASVGKVVDVLIEQENPETGELIGRSPRFSPDVDGAVYVRGHARLGAIAPVLINNADVYDLYGQIADRSTQLRGALSRVSVHA